MRKTALSIVLVLRYLRMTMTKSRLNYGEAMHAHGHSRAMLMVLTFVVLGVGCDGGQSDEGNSNSQWQPSQNCTTDWDCPADQSCIEGRCAAGDTGQFKVYGNVSDWISGQPLGGATVSLAGNTDQTDSVGAFSVPTLSEGNYVLTVAKSGYFTVSTGISVFGSDKQYQIALPANMRLYEGTADFFSGGGGDCYGQTFDDRVQVIIEGTSNCPYSTEFAVDRGEYVEGIMLKIPLKVLANNTVKAPSSVELHGDFACYWIGTTSQVDVKSELLVTEETGSAIFLYLTGVATFNDSEACSECLPNGEEVQFEIYTSVSP
jgi:hypothetical protein